MHTIRENKRNTISIAVQILKKGGIIIYPTETQYGIGGDVANKDAIKKIFEIKQRAEEKKVIWAFSDINMIKKYFAIDKEQAKLIKKLMPGPFTLVINDQGFRIPANKTARRIIEGLGKPITTTSANISGQKSSGKIKDIISLFSGKVGMIIDGGNLKKSKPSTVFRWEDKTILRKGPVTRKQIETAMKK